MGARCMLVGALHASGAGSSVSGLEAKAAAEMTATSAASSSGVGFLTPRAAVVAARWAHPPSIRPRSQRDVSMLLRGNVSRLLRSARSARMTCLRVSCGMITWST